MDDINKATEKAFRERVKMGQEMDEAAEKNRQKELAFIAKNLEAIQKYVRDSNKKIAEDRKKEIIENIKSYGQAVQEFGNFINTIVQSNIDSLDREITAQQRRIDRAVKYAERGGAELLEIEEERLAALEEKREKFARRQLQINAALALSNAIVAVATTAAESGIASIATIPAVLAAIAAGYAFVNTLEEPQNFAEGTKAVKGKGTETSDSVPANLSVNERVVSAKTSKKFKPILDDIQDGVFANQADLIASIQAGKYSSGMNYKAVIDSSQTNTTDNKAVVYALGEVKTAIEQIKGTKVIANEKGIAVFTIQQMQQISKRNKY